MGRNVFVPPAPPAPFALVDGDVATLAENPDDVEVVNSPLRNVPPLEVVSEDDGPRPRNTPPRTLDEVIYDLFPNERDLSVDEILHRRDHFVGTPPPHFARLDNDTPPMITRRLTFKQPSSGNLGLVGDTEMAALVGALPAKAPTPTDFKKLVPMKSMKAAKPMKSMKSPKPMKSMKAPKPKPMKAPKPMKSTKNAPGTVLVMPKYCCKPVLLRPAPKGKQAHLLIHYCLYLKY